jgi:hypothetical protein
LFCFHLIYSCFKAEKNIVPPDAKRTVPTASMIIVGNGTPETGTADDVEVAVALGVELDVDMGWEVTFGVGVKDAEGVETKAGPSAA